MRKQYYDNKNRGILDQYLQFASVKIIAVHLKSHRESYTCECDIKAA